MVNFVTKGGLQRMDNDNFTSQVFLKSPRYGIWTFFALALVCSLLISALLPMPVFAQDLSTPTLGSETFTEGDGEPEPTATPPSPATETNTQSPTASSTETRLAAETETPTETLTATPTQTETPTPTEQVAEESLISPYVQGQKLSLSGELNVLWGDDWSGNHLDSLFFLVANGQNLQLELSEQLLEAAGGLLAVQGRTVTATGRWTTDLVGPLSGTWEGLKVEQLSVQGPIYAPDGDISAAAVTGNKRYVNILCRFSNYSAYTPEPKAYYEGLFSSAYPGIDHYWRENSYNIVDISGTTTVGWFNLPSPLSSYMKNGTPDFGKLASDCAKLADANVNFAQFFGINLFFNIDFGCCAWGGKWHLTLDGVSKSWPMTWMPEWSHWPGIIGHEMGHSFGLPHSSGPYGDVYDSYWDVMSAGATCYDGAALYACPHTISYHKSRLGWIPKAQIFEPTANSQNTLVIERIAQSPVGSNYLMAKIKIPGTNRFYTVEARRFIGYDSDVPGQAIVIHQVNPSSSIPAKVVDADQNGDPNDAGAQWVVGETFMDASAKVHIQIVSQTATGYVVTITTGQGNLPAKPAQNGLANKAVISDKTPTLTWGGVLHASSYQLQISKNANFKEIVVTYNGPAITFTSNSLADGTYYWRVAGVNSLGYVGAWSATRSFTIDTTPPAIPVIDKPTNSATVRGVPAISWKKPSGSPVVYEVQYSTTANFSSGVQTFPGVKGVNFKAANFTPVGVRYVRVRAADAVGNWSSWSTAHTITILPLKPIKPVMVLPGNKANTNDTTPTLTWNAVPYGNTYQVQIATRPNFALSFMVQDSIRGVGVLNYTATTLAEGTYHWRVRAINVNGEFGAWSAVRSFTVDITAPAIPAISKPANSAIVRGVPTIAWKKPSGAPVAYEVQYSTAANFTSGVQTFSNIKGVNFKAANFTPVGVRYVRVRAADAAGNWSGWSATHTITILPLVPAKPPLSAPANKASTNDTTPTFTWNAVPYGNTYQIQIATTNKFTVIVRDQIVAGTTYTPTALPLGPYHWRVRAINVNGEPGPWSVLRSLSIR